MSHSVYLIKVRTQAEGVWEEGAEELHDLNSSANIIRVIKSRRMRWVRYERGRRGMHARFWWGSQKKRDHLEEERIILKWILEKQHKRAWTASD